MKALTEIEEDFEAKLFAEKVKFAESIYEIEVNTERFGPDISSFGTLERLHRVKEYISYSKEMIEVMEFLATVLEDRNEDEKIERLNQLSREASWPPKP
jgi:hypothetical protein